MGGQTIEGIFLSHMPSNLGLKTYKAYKWIYLNNTPNHEFVYST